MTGYSQNQGIQLLQSLQEEGQYVFDTETAREHASRIGIKPSYLNPLLSFLAESNWIVRLKKGLFATSGGLPGNITVHPFAIATSIAQPSAISHWSAMNYHGFTEQIPGTVYAISTKKIGTPSMRTGEKMLQQSKHAREIAGIRYEYTTVKREHFFGIQEIWIDEHFKIPITDKERTLLEGFIKPRAFGGMSEILGILEQNINGVNIEQLVEYSLQYGVTAVSKRLGWSLERLGANTGAVIALKDVPASRYINLDPTRPSRGKHDKNWMIRVNLTGVQNEAS